MKTFRTIIIDDERLAREELKSLLKDYHEIEKNICFTYFLYKKIIIYILKVILLIYLMYLPQVLLKLIMLEEI